MDHTASGPRQVPLPQTEPPVEAPPPTGYPERLRGPAPHAVQGALALSFSLPGGLPAVPQPPPGLRLVAALGLGDEDAPRPTPRGELPDPARWAPRLVQALLEVLAGDRPLSQLIRWADAEVYADLLRRLTVGAGSHAGRPGPARRGVLRSVRIHEPDDGVAEVAAVVARAGRVGALALRLEGLDGRWQCTALELG